MLLRALNVHSVHSLTYHCINVCEEMKGQKCWIRAQSVCCVGEHL